MANHSLRNMIEIISSHETAHLDSHLTSPAALYIACGTIAVKELLFRATMRVAKRTNSAVLVSSAWHHSLFILESSRVVLRRMYCRI